MNDQQELQQRLAQSTRSLVQFILGVNAFATRGYEEASSHFKDSVDASGLDLSAKNLSSQGTDGLETLLLLMGDLDSKQAAASVDLPSSQRRELFESARARYEQSLELDPEFARAYVGLAEVTFLQSAGSCPRSSSTVDVDGLKSAIDLYGRALASKHQPRSRISSQRCTSELVEPRTVCPAREWMATAHPMLAMRCSGSSTPTAQTTVASRIGRSRHTPMNGAITLLDEDYEAAARAFTSAIELSSIQSAREMAGEAERRYLFCRNLGRVHAHIGTVARSGADLPLVAAERACQQQFQAGFDLGKQGL